MTQFEFYKSFQFVLELIFAEVLYVYKLRKKPNFSLRLILALVAFFGFSFWFPVPTNNALYCSFTFLVIFSVSILLCKFLFDESWLTVLFCCVAGYTTQHLSYEIYMFVVNLTGANVEVGANFYGSNVYEPLANPFVILVFFFVYTLSYCACFFAFAEKIQPNEPVQLKTTFIFVGILFILFIDILLNALVTYHEPQESDEFYKLIIGTYNVVCCIISLYLQFEVALKKRLENTLDQVQNMWHQAKEQYNVSKENIELINMKCHDLKQQIRRIGTGTETGVVNPNVIKDIEKRIAIYDSTIKTGNTALDIILTEKSLLCNKNNIRFSCMVDGEKLSFMSEEDTYALFGNIVDNAIEAVSKVSDEKRVITLSIKVFGNFLTVRETNYYNDQISFESGLPLSNKKDKIYHGYGLKSVKYICECYGGELNIRADNNVFDLSIVFCLGDLSMRRNH